jgi:hypothetical protein
MPTKSRPITPRVIFSQEVIHTWLTTDFLDNPVSHVCVNAHVYLSLWSGAADERGRLSDRFGI